MPKKLLTVRKVKNIVKLLNNGDSCVSIGKKYGISREVVSDIKRGRTWSHITEISKPSYYTKHIPKVREGIFEGSMTDHAERIYTILKNYKNKSRQYPLRKYNFTEYRADLNHTRNGELFTVFQAKSDKSVKYICYGDRDTLYTCSWKTLLTRLV